MRTSGPPPSKQPSSSSARASDSDAPALRERYGTLEPLGEGGNAAVFRAYDQVRGAWVALKRLRRAGDAEGDHARLMLEGEYYTLKQLAHPSIIEVYDYGVDDELGPHYTMELLSGQDLQALLPLGWREACRLLRDVASSLAVVHSRRLVHRDITARNVRCTSDGNAKLIDFGALTQMGTARHVVGTPPYVPPEALHRQPLDARSDLYSLGALAYVVLSGRHAFPAPSFQRLRQLWFTRPPSLRSFDPTIPETLNALVMSLLESEPLARPQSAGEVMARLSSIADLPLTEAASVQHAYLASPKLAAREGELVQTRTHLLRAARGHAGTLFITGAAGCGRTRLLDTCVLDAELAGAVVLRADATDATAPFGVARRLIEELIAARPGLREKASELGLASAIGNARDRAGIGSGAAAMRRDALIANAARLLLSEAAKRTLAIAVDDVHAIDEPSLALLASLAGEMSVQRLSVMLTFEQGAAPEASLAWDVLRQLGATIALTPLERSDTRRLLASVFGEVPQLDMIAELIHGSSGGNPREIMDAAQRITDAQLARYAAGQWYISDQPARIVECLEQPSDVRSRLAASSGTARELLSLLALDRGHVLMDVDYAPLCPGADSEGLSWALSELLHARWLVRVGSSYHFSRPADQRGVEGALPAAERAMLHLRIAEHLQAQARDPLHQIHHFVHAGAAERAHDGMRRYIELADKSPLRIRAAIELDLVERMVEIGTRDAWPLPTLTLYRMQLMLLAAAFGAWERVLPHADVTLRALSSYAGLTDYDALADLPPAQRLGAAMKAAQARFDQVAGSGHPLPPIDAVRALTRVSTLAAASAYWMAEPAVFERIPSLGPLLPLSAALSLTERIVQAFRALACGQEWIGWYAFRQLYEDVRAMPDSQLDPRNRYTLELVVLSPVCFRDARHAAASTLDHCAALAPKQPDQAQNYAMLHHMVMGDVAAAERAREQCETLMLRAGATNDTRSTRLQVSSILFPLCDDLMALKRLAGELEAVREQRPGWRFAHAIVSAHVLRCQGELQRALAVIEEVLAALPEAHLEFAPAAHAHVMILTQLGELERALERGEHYRRRAAELSIPTAWLDLSVALCLSGLGRHTQAEALWQAALAALGSRDIGGVHLGYAYEMGARIARAHGDMVAFDALSQRCAGYYLAGRHPALAAKHRRLESDAQDPDEAHPSVAHGADDEATYSVLSKCADRTQRAQHASALLCEQTASDEVILLTARHGKLEPLAPGVDVAGEFLDAAQRYFDRELAMNAEVTRALTAYTFADAAAAAGEVDDSESDEIERRGYTPVLLRARDEQGELAAGVALLRAQANKQHVTRERLVCSVASALIALGDVEPVRFTPS